MLSISPETKQCLARTLRRLPWLVSAMKMALRLTRTRYTMGVVGIVMNDQDDILLVKHVFHPDYPWGLPGGWLEGSEPPVEALKRELREETGLEVCVLQPLLVDTGHYFRHHLDLAFLCRAKNDVQSLGVELLDYRWASLDDLPPMLPFHQAAAAAARSRHNNRSRP